MHTADIKKIHFTGDSGRLAQNIIQHWLLGLRESNPAILDIFRDRDHEPYRDLLPWSGEFAGKYITSAYYIYKMTGDTELYDYISRFIAELITYQDQNGYLGCYCKASQLTGANSHDPHNPCQTWDSWAHYHIMYGLLMWYHETGRQEYFDVILRMAELFLVMYHRADKPLLDMGFSEANFAVYHLFALLYQETGNREYLAFARKIEKELTMEGGGNYINCALEGIEFYQCPKPRWESLHFIMGIAQMYRATGEEKYLTAARQIVHSILKTDVHNTGGFSTEEQAVGNPYINGVIETCCVVAFNALAFEVAMLTGEMELFDFLERSHYNAVMGSFSPSGRWSTYNTPMNGTKCANFHGISFQCRPGSPELNCCSVNAPRGASLIGQWAVMEQGEELYINCYEAFCAELQDGSSITVRGDYPCNNSIQLCLDLSAKRKVFLRIPAWSKHTETVCAGQHFAPSAGTYFALELEGRNDISLTLGWTPYIQQGEGDCAGKASIYVGPVLYAWDNGLNHAFSWENLPALSLQEVEKLVPQRDAKRRIALHLHNGAVLTDFYHAGDGGSEYVTWLTVQE